jgi:hypothetical protein
MLCNNCLFDSARTLQMNYSSDSYYSEPQYSVLRDTSLPSMARWTIMVSFHTTTLACRFRLRAAPLSWGGAWVFCLVSDT